MGATELRPPPPNSPGREPDTIPDGLVAAASGDADSTNDEPMSDPDRPTGERPCGVAVEPDLPPLPATWLSDAKARRPMPKGVKWSLCAVAGVVALIVGSTRCRSADEATVAAAGPSSLEVAPHHTELKKRTPLSAADFATPVSRATKQTRPPSPAAQAAMPSVSLAERRARRANNPEDLIMHRKHRSRSPRRSAKPSGRASASSKQTKRSMFDVVKDEQADAPHRKEDTRLLAAASQQKAILAQPVVVTGGTQTAVARLHGPGLPAGTTLLGRARHDGTDRIAIRFSAAVLPGGQRLRISAVAQSDSGHMGLVAQVTGNASSPSRSRTVSGDVAKGSLRRALRAGLGTGIAGAAVLDAERAYEATSRSSRNGVPRKTTYELPRGTQMTVLFLEEVRKRGRK